jgi:hypothetical protein
VSEEGEVDEVVAEMEEGEEGVLDSNGNTEGYSVGGIAVV